MDNLRRSRFSVKTNQFVEERPIKRLWDEKYNFGRAVDEYDNWGGGSYFHPIGINHDRFYYSRLIINEADIRRPTGYSRTSLTTLYKQPYVKIKFAYIDLKKPDAMIEFSEISVETSEIGRSRCAVISPDGAFLYFQTCMYIPFREGGQMKIYKLDMKTLKWNHYIHEFPLWNSFYLPRLHCNENGIFIQYRKREDIEIPINITRTEWVAEYAFLTLDDKDQKINMEKISIPLPTLPLGDIQPNESSYWQLYESISTPFPLQIDKDPFRCEIVAIGRCSSSESFYSKLIVFKNGTWNLYNCESINVYNEQLGKYSQTPSAVSYCCSINNRIILKLACAPMIGLRGYFYEIVLNYNEKSWKITRSTPHFNYTSLSICIENGIEVKMSEKGFDIYRNEPHALAQMCCESLRYYIIDKKLQHDLMKHEAEGFVWHSDEEIKRLIKQVKSWY